MVISALEKMNYIIFDLEWNQPPDPVSMIQQPVYLTGEIVQIGAVKLDEKMQPCGSFSSAFI